MPLREEVGTQIYTMYMCVYSKIKRVNINELILPGMQLKGINNSHVVFYNPFYAAT